MLCSGLLLNQKIMMTQKAADALCTMIVIGYAKDILASTGKNAVFEYESTGDASAHETVKETLESYVEIDVNQSVSKATFPLIVAKTDRVSSTEIATLVGDTETKLSGELERKLEDLGLGGLYGAYIGGYSDTSKIELVGASDLGLYTPVYRAANDSVVETAYNNAKETSNKVINLLTAYQTSISGGKKVDGVNISVKDINSKITTSFSDGKVFKSFHGMIVAMTKYASSIDANSFIFEIACSSNTSKVSSCFPCATFMKSQNTPATSVHLGRGDNWNIPSSCSSSMKANWESKIIKWYGLGVAALDNNSDWNSFISDYRSGNSGNKLIPAMFLEALTFEKSFTKRIVDTLS
jgi:hypothetical protein